MMVRRLEENGRIATSGVQFIYGREAVAQTIKTRLSMFSGEYFRDIEDGTPWFQEILKAHANVTQVSTILKRRIKETEGVREIILFKAGEFDMTNRILPIKTDVLTIYSNELIRIEGPINGRY